MEKEIEFIYLNDFMWKSSEKPQPSKNFIPDWFKKMTPYDISPQNPDGTSLIVENLNSNATAKKCMPMLDAITSGYTIPLWSDVQVREVDLKPRITWRSAQDVFEMHGSSSMLIDTPPGYHGRAFKFISWLQIKTPPGYSIMVTTPSGHYNSPFRAIPAIIDSDTPTIDLSFPVWVKKGFSGIVEKGHPMVQIIPFKRENWKSKFSYITEEQYKINQQKGFYSTIVNHYIKNAWKKKKYT